MMLVDICTDASFILRIIVKLVKVMQLLIPILLIVLVSVDLFKIVAGADEKAKKENADRIVKRVIYAVIVFLVPVIINFIFRQIDPLTKTDSKVSTTTTTSWISCWNHYYNE